MLGSPARPSPGQNAEIPGEAGGNGLRRRLGKTELTQVKLRAGEDTRGQTHGANLLCRRTVQRCSPRHKSPQRGIKGSSSCHQWPHCFRGMKSVPGPGRSQPPSVPGPSRVPARPCGTAPRCGAAGARQDAHPLLGSTEAKPPGLAGPTFALVRVDQQQ